MAQRLFQITRRQIYDPLITPKANWAFPQVNTTSQVSTDGKKQYTTAQKHAINTAKALAIFLPGVYIGYLLTRNNGKTTDKNVDDSKEIELSSVEENTSKEA